ncbi:hypothetical protein TNIN_76731 [Trichonephila inaurata madagascariensis]|uniref:Uncharacterized protein n=1 Tax=Trichonephila inaurata madagascariensis TaxID=2747483 RepID=A0A8X6XD00_9ARAC|nr:hypothetical protein TNIN_76731 [Trichonephila inaurata madagascariensis]
MLFSDKSRGSVKLPKFVPLGIYCSSKIQPISSRLLLLLCSRSKRGLVRGPEEKQHLGDQLTVRVGGERRIFPSGRGERRSASNGHLMTSFKSCIHRLISEISNVEK